MGRGNGRSGARHRAGRSDTRGLSSSRRPTSDSDVLDRVAAIEAFDETGRLDGPLGHINRAAARFVLHVRDQLLRELRRGTVRFGDAQRRHEWTVPSV